MRHLIITPVSVLAHCIVCVAASAAVDQKPYDPQCTERANVFAFTEKPKVTCVGKDRYEIAFSVKGSVPSRNWVCSRSRAKYLSLNTTVSPGAILPGASQPAA